MFKDRINACEEYSNSSVSSVTFEELQAYFKAQEEANKAKIENLIILSLVSFITVG